MALFALSIFFGGVSWVRYPLSHDLLHALVPLFALPPLFAWRPALGVGPRLIVMAVTAWVITDALFGLGNAVLPGWADSLAFDVGAVGTLLAVVVKSLSVPRSASMGVDA